MITPKELLAKAEKLFLKVVSSQLKDENIFPLVIPANKQVAGSNFSDWKNDLVPLHQHSKALKYKGYTVDWKERNINGSTQSVPAKIYFSGLEDFLYFVGKATAYQQIVAARNLIVEQLPALTQWANNNPAIILDNVDHWDSIIKVCRYFINNEPPHPYYMRELPIPVHTKFIEDNERLLKKLLDLLLPDEKKNLTATDFPQRYYLKKISVYTQIRILDDELKSHLGYDECALTLEDAAWLNWTPKNVFIIENQVCFLTFPKVTQSVVIFGEGFKSRLSRHIPWLNKTRLYCWFDLDAAGFEMLNMIREYYPPATSFLMDEVTYNRFQHYAVDNTNRKKLLPALTAEEQHLYQFLLANNKRLEQERIAQSYIQERLNAIIQGT
ncbi:MAG: hypothetical protein JWP81_1088 [Ferruginibacter sp.]|nr:hypothetical protein [Ferruginibacter sp.]